jgi:ATP-binding cassette subfamily B (MDR/TAP) protein 1
MALVFGAAGAGQAFSYSPDLTKAIHSTSNVTQLLDHKSAFDLSRETGYHVDTLKEGRIEFKDVYFSYASRYFSALAH